MTMATKSRRKQPVRRSGPLTAIRPYVAGIDVGSREHWVCGPARENDLNVRPFGTTTAELEALADWLVAQHVESVVMESTSVYWIPLYEVLEARGIEPVLVDARQLHNVPGRKTDVRDCQWLQTLHSHGLLRGSFRPSDDIVRLRSLQRQQANFVEQRTKCVQWMQKALDQMNIQVHHAVSNLVGETGLAIVRAIVAGERDPARLAAYRHYACRKSEAQIAEHLRGNWRDDHLFNLAMALRMYDELEATIVTYDARLVEALASLAPADRADQQVPRHPNAKKERSIRNRGQQELRTTLWRFCGADLSRIDGISGAAARTILTEVGANLAAFPSERHFVSWLRLCPRTPISGGKPLKKRRNGLGSNRVSAVLRMAAVSLQRSKSALGAEYRRIARRKSAAIAVFAIARKLAQIVYRQLKFGHEYTDVGEAVYEARMHARRLAGITAAASALGYALTPTTVPPPASPTA
jgi:transposase